MGIVVVVEGLGGSRMTSRTREAAGSQAIERSDSIGWARRLTENKHRKASVSVEESHGRKPKPTYR